MGALHFGELVVYERIREAHQDAERARLVVLAEKARSSKRREPAPARACHLLRGVCGSNSLQLPEREA